MIKKYLSAVALASVLIAGSAFAQVIPVPQVQKLGQTDLTNVIPGGAPGAQSVYVPVGGIGGLFQYSYQVPLTAFALTVPNFVSFEYLNPAGTLATGTLTMSASPSDGQNFCLQDTQTQTAITISANTGQSLGGLSTPTALVAATRYCWFYNASLSTWLRYL